MKKDKIIEITIEAIVVVALGLIMIGIICGIIDGINAPDDGIVIEKRYVPGYEYTAHEYGRVDGKYIEIPVRKYQGERYIVIIEGTGKNGKKATAAVYVTKEEYDGVNIGDYWRIRQQEVK